tara:strand:+ start:640 stop:759 length:120 start_codon:yes stop_codon:yes gene_type:complete
MVEEVRLEVLGEIKEVKEVWVADSEVTEAMVDAVDHTHM